RAAKPRRAWSGPGCRMETISDDVLQWDRLGPRDSRAAGPKRSKPRRGLDSDTRHGPCPGDLRGSLCGHQCFVGEAKPVTILSATEPVTILSATEAVSNDRRSRLQGQ